jgi:hypothetical protein
MNCQHWERCDKPGTNFVEIPDDNGEPMDLPLCDEHYARYMQNQQIIREWKNPTTPIE